MTKRITGGADSSSIIEIVPPSLDTESNSPLLTKANGGRVKNQAKLMIENIESLQELYGRIIKSEKHLDALKTAFGLIIYLWGTAIDTHFNGDVDRYIKFLRHLAIEQKKAKNFKLTKAQAAEFKKRSILFNSIFGVSQKLFKQIDNINFYDCKRKRGILISTDLINEFLYNNYNHLRHLNKGNDYSPTIGQSCHFCQKWIPKSHQEHKVYDDYKKICKNTEFIKKLQRIIKDYKDRLEDKEGECNKNK